MKPHTYEARQDGERCALASLSPSLTLLATATTREWRHHTVHPRCLQPSLPIARNSRPLAASSDGLHDVPPLRPVPIPAPGMLSPPPSLRRTSPCSRLCHVQVPQVSTFAHPVSSHHSPPYVDVILSASRRPAQVLLDTDPRALEKSHRIHRPIPRTSTMARLSRRCVLVTSSLPRSLSHGIQCAPSHPRIQAASH